jgi:hypothetical protein
MYLVWGGGPRVGGLGLGFQDSGFMFRVTRRLRSFGSTDLQLWRVIQKKKKFRVES